MPTDIRTARLKLSVIGRDSAPVVHEILGDPLTNTLGDGPFVTLAQTRAWIERREAIRAEFGLCWYLLTTVDTRDAVGTCGILPGRTGHAEPEIAYMTRTLYRRQGFATEAAAAVTGAAHAAGVGTIWATVRPQNQHSLQVLRACGFDVVRSEADDKGPLVYLCNADQHGNSVGPPTTMSV